MNVLVEALKQELKEVNLGIMVKKETTTKLDCYLFDLDDGIKLGKNIVDYRKCKKFDVYYKKTDLVLMRDNHTLKSYAQNERKAYDMAKKLNLLRG